MTQPAAENPSAVLWRSAVVLAAFLLLLHVVAAAEARDPRIIVPHGVAWLHDLAILMLLAGTFAMLTRLRWRAASRIVRLAGCGVLVATAMLLALYPRMLQVFLAAPANFLETDAAAAGTFVRDYLGVQALWPATVALVVGLASCRVRSLRVGRRWLIAGAPLFLLSVVALGRDSPNPVVFGLQDSIRQLWVPRAVPRIKTAVAGATSPLGSPAIDWNSASREARYEHVVLAVLEGVTASDFEAGFIRREQGFFARHQQHARYFDRHYSTNLDSYTALVAMTTSVQVPFRAYAAPERYASVNDAPNIVRGLRGAGFRGLFISTYEHQPFVPNPCDWDKVLDRGDLGDLKGWTSLGSNRMEAATEDRAALPTVVDFMRAGSRSLVLAELVFGHSPEWRAKTGLTPVDYYDRYLTDLWAKLTAAGLASRTLLVVISDHGDRSRSSDPENYRVPLLIVGEGVEPGEDRAFRSHLDLQAIVAHFLVSTAMPAARSAVTFVGSTERWIYGMLIKSGEHAFIDDNSGRLLSEGLPAAEVHAAFQAHVSAFVMAFQPGQR
ncbi:MAG: sulfatase-like hydrolase/transferase [Gemmatimonadota bacterium]